MYAISSSAASSLGGFLGRCPQISNLNLSGSPDLFATVGLRRFLLGLNGKALPGLRSLDLAGCNVQPEAAELLGRLLARCHNLGELHLRGNPALFTQEGLKNLDQGLGSTGLAVLSRLHIGDCNIQAVAAPSLGAILGRCAQLQRLSLSQNRGLLTPDGIDALHSGLNGASLPSLQELALYRCNVRTPESKDRVRELLGAPEHCTIRI